MNRKKVAGAGVTRRGLLGLGAGAAAFWGAGTWAGCGPGDRRPKQVIFLVPDGMSSGVPAMAESFSQLVRREGTHWHSLLRSGRASLGFFDMASQNSLVTDSAAAASAWGSGRRVPNGLVNQYADGTLLTPLVPLLHERGKAAGLVTTARITHATPAGFCATVPHRDQEDRIAEQYLVHRPRVLLGGGSKHFDPAVRKDGRDLVGEFSAAGYSRVTDRSGLQQTESDHVLGLFSPDHMPYAIDRLQDGRQQEALPALSEMTAKALELLGRGGNGFFLMVEGARVDHAAHANDAAGLLWEQLAFDDAIGVALAFQKRNPETLVVIGSDHGNANPGLNGMGGGYRESTECFARLARGKSSAAVIRTRLKEEMARGKAVSWTVVRDQIKSQTGHVLNTEECAALLDVLQSRPVGEFSSQQKNFYGLLGQMMGNWTGIGWTGVTHTSDWTQTLAVGPGQEAFAGLMQNTDFFLRMSEIFGINHRNPEDAHPVPPSVPAERAVADPTG